MPFHFKGQSFESVPWEKMSPSEVHEVEQITGLNYKRIRFAAGRCICEHLVQEHLHYDDEQHLDVADTTCGAKGCRCVGFSPDLPVLAEYAALFIAARRNDPEIRWDDIRDLPQDEWTYERGAEADPTSASEEATSE